MIDQRTARLLLAVRELLRNVAAANQQLEQERRARALDECTEAARQLSMAHARARAAMLAAPNVEVLALEASAFDTLRVRADELAAALEEAERRVEHAAAALRARSRQAHGATRLAEKAAHYHSQREQRREQLLHDDLLRRGPQGDHER